MIVPIAVTPPNAFSPKLPPTIAKLGHDELFLIELQGMLDVQGSESTAKDGQLIGTLNTADMVRTRRSQERGFMSRPPSLMLVCLHKNKPTLVIGHHLLEGKVVSLPKPLGVLHKHVRNDGPSSVHASDDPEHQGDGEKQEEEAKEIRWDVAAVVKKKIVFSKRPMPIAKPASMASGRT